MHHELASHGKITIDGRVLQDYSHAEIRRIIGYVPQSSFLFSKSLADNIGFGSSQNPLPEENLLEASSVAALHKDVMNLKLGYQTMIGEKGVTLSGGQRQRAALARAIVGEHLIYIFDDSFSSVDHETEEGILYELKEFLHNRTCIFITHRISTLKLCNRILYLENGSISEQGGHEDLMKIKGLYYKTYLLQQALTGDRV